MTTTTPDQGRSIHAAETTVPALRDKNGRVRSIATLPGYRKGQKPGNHGKLYPPTALFPADVELLISARSRTSASGLRDRAHIGLLYGTGLRIQESLDLLPGDVTEEEGLHQVLVRRGKGGKMRRVALMPDAVPHLSAWINRRAMLGIDDNSRLFCTIALPRPGGPLGSPQVRTMLKRASETTGLGKRVHPHALRHGHAVMLMRMGIPLPLIQRQLGHSSLAVTSTYMQTVSDDERFDSIGSLTWAQPEPVEPESMVLVRAGDLADRVRAASEGGDGA